MKRENGYSKGLKGIGVIIIIGGIIISLYLGSVFKVQTTISEYLTEENYNGTIAIAGSITSFISGLLLMSIGEIIELLQSCYNKQYETSLMLEELSRNNNKNLDKSGWKCPKCGNVHQNYVGTCGCGEKKPV